VPGEYKHSRFKNRNPSDDSKNAELQFFERARMIFIKFQYFMETISLNKTAQVVSSENKGGPSIWESKWNVFAPISLGVYSQ
jgi:hypothetical protein